MSNSDSTNEAQLPTTEQAYLEMADIFKEQMNKKEKDLIVLKEHQVRTFKLVMMSYTIFRMMDDILDNVDFSELPDIGFLLNNVTYMRGQISEFLDHIHNIKSEIVEIHLEDLHLFQEEED